MATVKPAPFPALGTRFARDLESAGITASPLHVVTVAAIVAAALWLVIVFTLAPGPLVAIAMLLVLLALAAVTTRVVIARRRGRRIDAFRDQLEGALRTLSGGVRVGLGIRQALVLTSEQCREPARSELARVVGLSNVGVSILDAFDALAERMTMAETRVLARTIRVQAQTGGDLGAVLDGLAGTIRDRRRLRRRVAAVTAQGKATAWLLGLLPIAVGGFVITQPELRDAMLGTLLGRFFLGIALALDALAIVALSRIARIDP